MLSLLNIEIANSESIPIAVFGGGTKDPTIIVRNAMEEYEIRAAKVVGFCNVTKMRAKHDYETNTAEIWVSDYIPLFEVVWE